jgi:hypothetical protein
MSRWLTKPSQNTVFVRSDFDLSRGTVSVLKTVERGKGSRQFEDITRCASRRSLGHCPRMNNNGDCRSLLELAISEQVFEVVALECGYLFKWIAAEIC